MNVLSDAHEHTLLQLVYSNCVPILLYASPVKLLSSAEMMHCTKAMNDVLQKIFGFTDWRSIRTLREIFHFRSLTEMFASSQRRFLEKAKSHTNPIIKTMVNVGFL